MSLDEDCLAQVWETGVTSPLESPRALTDDLPSFSLSPLPYITEVRCRTITVEPRNKGHFGSTSFVLFSEAVLWYIPCNVNIRVDKCYRGYFSLWIRISRLETIC